MMSSSFKKKLLPSAMAVAMASGAMLSGNANAIHVSEKGIGQVLMAPLYMADYGYNSKVSIVNTRTDTAVKARIALRSRVNSIEFDFLCYMSPGDVCQFEIVRGDDGQAYLKSNDDSILANRPSTANDYRPIFASQCATEPSEFCKDGYLYVKMYDDQLPTNTDGVLTEEVKGQRRLFAAHAHTSNADDNELGHIEVIGAWGAQGSIKFNSISDAAVAASLGTLQNRVLIERGMSKADLYKIMGPLVPETATGIGVSQNRQRLAGYVENDGATQLQNEAGGYATGRMVNNVCQIDPILAADALQGSSIVKASYYGEPCVVGGGILPYKAPASTAEIGSKIRSTDPRWIRLTGMVEMESASTSDRMGLQMSALDGDVWDNLPPSDNVPSYGMNSYQQSGLGQYRFAFDGRLISNPFFDASTGDTLSMGFTFGSSRAGLGDVGIYDNIIEIEHALAANAMNLTYENDGQNLTNVIITFPTKYRHLSALGYQAKDKCTGSFGDRDPAGDRMCIENNVLLDDEGDVCGGGLRGRYYYPPFRSEQTGSVLRKITSYDNQENVVTSVGSIDPFSGKIFIGQDLAITDEVNYMFVDWPFTQGWAEVGLTAEVGCQYQGVPVLAYAHKTKPTAAGFSNSWLVPLTKDSDTDQ
ncbi:hypothetical protein QUF61_17410 [Candidatus Venteria ishoeyi]|uniref:hypothetical protein n=1 Tax=Candidatus Venteria ishoeyi TaxID=1899563 RepID=UPI0025A6069F|nr:hypothetical protein [Candidatus Venteria ishoeyi]MDM8548272.1 hypothetical protein [Candidatus Venteria ishoeyi]